MTNELDNIQLILIAEAKRDIEAMRAEGKPYSEIRLAIPEKYESHWLVTSKRLRDEAIAVALLAYGMNDEEREMAKKFKELTGHMIV